MNKPPSPTKADPNEPEIAPTKGLSGMAWFFIVVVAALVLSGIFGSRPPKRDVFNPAINKAVNAQIEAADIRSGFSLTDDQVKEIASKTFLEEARKEKHVQP